MARKTRRSYEERSEERNELLMQELADRIVSGDTNERVRRVYLGNNDLELVPRKTKNKKKARRRGEKDREW